MTAKIIKFPERKPAPRVYVYDESVPRRQPPKPAFQPLSWEWWDMWFELWGRPE